MTRAMRVRERGPGSPRRLSGKKLRPALRRGLAARLPKQPGGQVTGSRRLATSGCGRPTGGENRRSLRPGYRSQVANITMKAAPRQEAATRTRECAVGPYGCRF